MQLFLALNISQTTAEVEEALKKGLPAERPVRDKKLRPSILKTYGLVAIENRDPCKQAKPLFYIYRGVTS